MGDDQDRGPGVGPLKARPRASARRARRHALSGLAGSLASVDRDATSDSAVSGSRFSVHASGNERLPSVREHDDVTGLGVRARVLEAEVVAGGMVEASAAQDQEKTRRSQRVL